jgi:hypothetical protein
MSKQSGLEQVLASPYHAVHAALRRRVVAAQVDIESRS